MRLLPLFTSLVVAAAIFVLVFQRDLVMPPAKTVTEDMATTEETVNAAVLETTVDRQVSVVVINSVAQPIDSRVIVRGQTEAARQVNLLAETSGAVISDPLPRGSQVSAGQIMCELDPGTREASLAEAKARLAEAKAQVPATNARITEALARVDEAKINQNAASKLSEGGFASETRVASAQAALDAAEAGLVSAQSGLETVAATIQSAEAGVAAVEKDIERLTIRASFDGILETDTAELGSVLQPGALCATVIQLDPIRFVGYVPEAQVNRLQLGAMAGAQMLDGTTRTGQVTFISRSADSATRTFRMEIEVPNTDLSVRDGQSADIAIQAEGSNAHLVPGSALTLNPKGDLGLRTTLEDGTVKFVPVRMLRDTVEGVWVDGLRDMAQVIVVGQEFVTDGVKAAVTVRGSEQ